MNARSIFTIVRKDLKVVSQNKGVVLPIVISILFMFVILPLGLTLLPSMVNIGGLSANDSEKIQWLITRLPEALQMQFAGLTINQMVIVYLLVYMFAPLTMIIPLMVSSVIAADSFAGEKERKTMEALLYTPTTDRELFIGKLLSGWLTAVVVALVGFVLYAITANLAAWPQMQRIFIPNTMWLVLIFWVMPALPGLGLGVMVLVSARAQGFQDANQMGGAVVLLVILLFYLQISGAMAFSALVLALVGVGIWLLDILLIWLGNRIFRRSRLLGA